MAAPRRPLRSSERSAARAITTAARAVTIALTGATAALGAVACTDDAGPSSIVPSGDAGDAEIVSPDAPAPDAEVDAGPQWSAAIGTWCGPADGPTVWLTLSSGAATCAEHAQHIAADTAVDGFGVELPASALAQLPSELHLTARWCRNGACRTAPLTLALTDYRAGIDLLGHWQVTLPDGTAPGGDFNAEVCDWNTVLPLHPEGTGLVRGLTLAQIAVFQSVKIPLMERSIPITSGRANVVAARSALLRAYVEPATGWQPRRVTGRLTISDQDANGQALPPVTLEQTKLVTAASSDDALDSTFNLAVSADSIQPTSTYSFELLEAESCAAPDVAPTPARFPDTGTAALGAHAVGGVRIQIVPILVSGLPVPDSSPEQLERDRKRITQLFPITGAEITLRSDAVTTTATTMVDVLDELAALRDTEAPGPDVSYYGLVSFDDTLAHYCASSCVLGAALTGDPNNPAAGTAVGIGFTGDEAATTFAHELGHVYGRIHSPCNTSGDPSYPYSGGRIGSWGYDLLAQTLMDPSGYTDFMGYCSPVWVSDYVFGLLQTYIASVNRGSTGASKTSGPGPIQSLVGSAGGGTGGQWRTLILEPGNTPRWGVERRVRGLPPGIPESARVRDARGRMLGSVTAYRSSIADADREILYLPVPGSPAWDTVEVREQPPQRYPAPRVAQHLHDH